MRAQRRRRGVWRLHKRSPRSSSSFSSSSRACTSSKVFFFFFCDRVSQAVKAEITKSRGKEQRGEDTNADKVPIHKELREDACLALLGHHTARDFVAGDVDELKVVSFLFEEPSKGLRVLLGLCRAAHRGPEDHDAVREGGGLGAGTPRGGGGGRRRTHLKPQQQNDEILLFVSFILSVPLLLSSQAASKQASKQAID